MRATKEADMGELRAAAERLRAHRGPGTPYPGPDDAGYVPDCITLARAYLAETDPTPVTADRLRSLGFTRHMQPARDNDLSYHAGPGKFVIYCPPKSVNDLPRWAVCGEWLPDCMTPKTVGDLRAVCRMAGVPLTEGTK